MISLAGIEDDKVTGYLGNKLFLLANGYSVAKKSNERFVLPPFEFQDLFENRFFEIERDLDRSLPIYNEPNFYYDEIPPLKNHMLAGYFQSWKYFDEKEIQKLFKPNTKLKESILNNKNLQLNETYGDILTYNRTTSIHVRLGDYENFSQYHTNLPISYYSEAMGQVPKTDYFIIFSNNIERCKKMFLGNKYIFSESPQEKNQGNISAGFDLYLQSMTNNHIIANSSFSWWSAFLNDSPYKKIISPNGNKYRWFGPANEHLNTKDLLPNDWIKL